MMLPRKAPIIACPPIFLGNVELVNILVASGSRDPRRPSELTSPGRGPLHGA